MQNDFNFCPNCGGKNIKNVNMRKWKCDDCGFTLYNNVAAAVGLVIQNEQGKEGQGAPQGLSCFAGRIC